MDDLYDEFGNYIGGSPAESEEEYGDGDAGPSYVYDEESEAGEEVNDQQLMEVDSTSLHTGAPGSTS